MPTHDAEVGQQNTVHAKIIRKDGTVEDLGLIAFQHPSKARMKLWDLGLKRLATLGLDTGPGED